MPEDNEAEEYADEDPDVDAGLGAIHNRLVRLVDTIDSRKPVSYSFEKEIKKVKDIVRLLTDWCKVLPVLPKR